MSERDLHWQEFTTKLLARLEQGEEEYGDRSFSEKPAVLLREIEEELLDACNWSFILYTRISRLRDVFEEFEETLRTMHNAMEHVPPLRALLPVQDAMEVPSTVDFPDLVAGEKNGDKAVREWLPEKFKSLAPERPLFVGDAVKDDEGWEGVVMGIIAGPRARVHWKRRPDGTPCDAVADWHLDSLVRA